MDKALIIKEPSELTQVTKELRSLLSEGRNIVLLKGDLGTGKTALVKNYVQEVLGITADSPTFNIVNTYSKEKVNIHHFDLYRLETAEEIEDIGFWDYVDNGDLCFIEWPEKIAELLPLEQLLEVQIHLSSKPWREYRISYS